MKNAFHTAVNLCSMEKVNVLLKCEENQVPCFIFSATAMYLSQL